MSVQTLPVWLAQLDKFRESFIVTYQFWFVLGGIVAFHYERVVAFTARHSKAIMAALVLSTLAVWAHYFVDRLIVGEAEGRAQMVVQPIMIPYSAIVTIAMLYVGSLMMKERGRVASAAIGRIVAKTSNASFGILLFQPILIVLAQGAITRFDQMGISRWVHFGLWPVSILFIYVAGALLSDLVGRIPYLSYIVGRKTKGIRRSDSASAAA